MRWKTHGKFIITASWDQTARIWIANIEDLLAEAARLIQRDPPLLTPGAVSYTHLDVYKRQLMHRRRRRPRQRAPMTKRRKPLMHRQPPRPKHSMLVLPKLRLRLRQQTLGRLAQLRLQKNEKQRNTHWT